MTSELPTGPAAVLDGRFPIDTSSETAPHFDALIRAAIRGGWDAKFLQDETSRAAHQAGAQSVVAAHGGERRYMRPLEETAPWQLPDDWYKPPYRELTEESLAHEWDTSPRTAVLDGV